MKTIGLTGGIATGKSSASKLIRQLGHPVVDADLIAREVVEPGTPGLTEIVAFFGPTILLPSGRLNREELGKLVFADEEKRKQLERILHPKIFIALQERLHDLKELGTPYAFVEAALMVETGSYRLYDALIVIYCTQELQIQRVRERDSLTLEEAGSRINAQYPQQDKIEKASLAIENNSTVEALQQTIETLIPPFLSTL